MNGPISYPQATAHRGGRLPPRRTSTIIIGAGHNGMAMSHYLAQRQIDHVILERGAVANSWRNERWDSLRLLTPNWQCHLPGQAYQGSAPHAFMPVRQLIDRLDSYAGMIEAPLHTHCEVKQVRQVEGGYRITSTDDEWQCRSVVIASGACNTPVVPDCSTEVTSPIAQLTPHTYRNPGQLAPGGVLVVGASATGIQLADEIQRAGHPVTLCVGEHVRMPRRYRNRDLMWWLEHTGLLDEDYREVDDIVRARHVPSSQLVGSPDNRTLDLNTLSASGVELVGRLVGISGGQAHFSGALANTCQLADLKMRRLLNHIDQWVADHPGEIHPPEQAEPEPTRLPRSPRLKLQLAQYGIRTIIWACGYRPDYSWLNVPALDQKGRLRHDGGITTSPGLYVMGLPFLRRRRSSLICGANDDARAVSRHLSHYLRQWSIDSVKRRAVAG